ncbi:MAG: response regulator [Lachnotalea sp.]
MNIVIVDDDKLVALSLKTILEASGEVKVLEMGQNGVEAIELYNKYKPEVLLMDIRMDTMSGIEAANIIISKYPTAKILFLTTFSDDEYIIQALNIGAKGYILKQNFESILPAMKAIFSGQNVFGNEIVSKIPNLINNNKAKDYATYGITDKEFEMIEAVAKGFSNKEIAQALYLSEGTVRNYLSIILDKLNLRDRTQLAVFYYRN